MPRNKIVSQINITPAQGEGTSKNGIHIALSGDLTAKTARQLFEEMPKFSAEAVSIDLSAVKETDSAGFALLVHWSNLATSASCQLRFIQPPPQLQELAKISNLEELFNA